jgi:hypothetical protein
MEAPMTAVRLRSIVTLVAAIGLVPSTSRAQQIVDFSSLSSVPCLPSGDLAFVPSPVTVSGFVFTSSNTSFNGALATWCPGTLGWVGVPALFSNILGATMTMTKVGGGLFSPQSISMACYSPQFAPAPCSVFLTAIKANGQATSQQFNGLGASLSQFQFNSSFNSIRSLSFEVGPQVGQIVNASATPEPATLLLVAPSIAAFGLVRRRRQRR